MPELDVELPQAPSGRPPFRKIEGSLFLPEAVATDVQRQAEEMDAMDAGGITPPLPDEEEHSTHSPEERDHFPSLGGGVPSPFIFREEDASRAEAEEPAPASPAEQDKTEDEKPAASEDAEQTGDKSGPEEDSDDEVVQQPIPFQMGVTPNSLP